MIWIQWRSLSEWVANVWNRYEHCSSKLKKVQYPLSNYKWSTLSNKRIYPIAASKTKTHNKLLMCAWGQSMPRILSDKLIVWNEQTEFDLQWNVYICNQVVYGTTATIMSYSVFYNYYKLKYQTGFYYVLEKPFIISRNRTTPRFTTLAHTAHQPLHTFLS